MEAGADVNIITDDGDTALSEACEGRIIEIVDRLLVHGATIDIYNSANPPIIAAVKGGNIDIVDRLIGMTADINIEDTFKRTPLSIVIKEKELEIIKLLIDEGANTQNIRTLARKNSYNLINMWLVWYDTITHDKAIDIMNKLRF